MFTRTGAFFSVQIEIIKLYKRKIEMRLKVNNFVKCNFAQTNDFDKTIGAVFNNFIYFKNCNIKLNVNYQIEILMKIYVEV